MISNRGLKNVVIMGFESFTGGNMKNEYILAPHIAKGRGGYTKMVRDIHKLGKNSGRIEGGLGTTIIGACTGSAIYAIKKKIDTRNKKLYRKQVFDLCVDLGRLAIKSL